VLTLPSSHTTTSDYSFDVLLGNIQATIRMVWNPRVQFWFMDYSDSRGNELYGIKVVPNWPLLASHKAFSAIEGALMAVSTTEYGPDEITYDNWQKDWALCWLDDTELTTWEGYYGIR